MSRARCGRCAALLSVLLALACWGCLRKDYPTEGPVVSEVELLDADAVDPDEVLDRLSTAESPQFLGIWDGVVFEYEVFDPALLARDLDRIERYYRARGYYEAKVTAARIVKTDEHRVRVEIRMHEGVPVRVVQMTPRGTEKLPLDVGVAAIEAIQLKRGEPFDEALYEESKRELLNALADRGYAFARVKGQAQLDLARHEATVWFDVDPGPPAVYGPVRIVGLQEIPERPVRANLSIEEGAPYSRAELEDARNALINLGVFATVEVQQDIAEPETKRVPVTVRVQESALRTLRLGGGTRLDVLEWSSHLSIGWEHRNFLGGMRRFSIDTKPGVVFYPTRIDNLVAPRELLPKNAARAELRQPAFIEGRTTGFLATEFNIYPVLYPDLGKDEEENVIGFYEVKANTGLERAFFGHHLYLTPSYNWQANFPFAYIGVTRDGLDRVFVSYPEILAVIDFRDDPIEPHSGFFFSNSAQVAGYIFGGDASDVKIRPEARTYVPVSRTVTFATRATVGFIFPGNYGDTLQDPTADDSPDPAVVRDQQLLLFRAFYSGGPNSNRGYAFRGVGPHGVLWFVLPPNITCQGDEADRPECFRPLGGLTLWEASVEVRFPIAGPVRGATFVDASDVTREVAQIRFDFPHLSAGLGMRYATPVGPIRLDVGYRLPFAQNVGEESLRRQEGDPSEILGLPVAVHFGLGEAF